MKEFDIDNIKKENPYKVPDDFFQTITKETLEKAKKRERRISISKWGVLSASIAASLLLVFFITTFAPAEGNSLKTFAFDDTVKQLYDDYSYVVDDSFSDIPELKTSSQDEIDKVLSEFSDEEINNIFLDSESEIFYAQL